MFDVKRRNHLLKVYSAPKKSKEQYSWCKTYQENSVEISICTSTLESEVLLSSSVEKQRVQKKSCM